MTPLVMDVESGKNPWNLTTGVGLFRNEETHDNTYDAI